MADNTERERRRTRRVRIRQGMKVRPAKPKDGSFEEIGISSNVSQDGVYFVTPRAAYRQGMRLFVTLPYHSPFSRQNYEYLGEVTRVDERGLGQWGVAVKFLPSAKKGSRQSQTLEFVR